MMKRCKNCDTEFKVKPSHYDKKTYCCKACMAEDYKTRLSGKGNPNYRGIAEQRVCPCGAIFTVETTGRIGNYCSLSCSATYRPGNVDRLRSQAGKANRAANRTRHERRKQHVCGICGVALETRHAKYCDKCRRPAHLRGRKDDNQNEIVRALKEFGAAVIDASHVKSGFPDLIVAYGGRNYLIELKNSKTVKPGRTGLTPCQQRFHASWQGQVGVAYTTEDALRIIQST